MDLIHHVVSGQGEPPIVFVHGFGCALADWDAQIAHFAPGHRTVAVDLRGHGASPGEASDCSIERYGADVAQVLRALGLPPAVLVGHSMGCRVVTEAALQAPGHVAGMVLVDGSQFSVVMEGVLKARFAEPDGYAAMVRGMFVDMFTPKSDVTVAAAVVARAARLPRAIGEALLLDMQRYDVERFAAALSDLRVPVMALQTTYSNEKRERQTLHAGQVTPYLEMVRASVPSARIEVIPDTGHFPQLDEAERTNLAIRRFVDELGAQ